jgi:hypothetical protein
MITELYRMAGARKRQGPPVLLFLAALSLLFSWSMRPAYAVPAFATQTGQPCTACHVGGYGPQLTPFGRAFKIGGYTQSGGDGLASKIPLSAMVLSSLTQTSANQPSPAATHFARNTNPAIDQVSVFLAGRINDYLGGMVQGTYNGINVTEKLDNTDLRATDEFDFAGSTLRVGISVNNGPTVQDPYNTTFAWGFPYVQSALAPTPSAQPLLAGALIGNTLGTTVYAWWNSHLYVEAGAYQLMDDRAAKTLGVYPQFGNGSSAIPYARVAYEWDWNDQAAEIGAMYLHADVQPLDSPGGGTDAYSDMAIDGSYQYLPNGPNNYTLNAIFVHEEQNLRATFGAGGSATPHKALNQLRANASWIRDQTYQFTLGVQETYGTGDSVLYAPGPVSGSNKGTPDSTAFIAEADWIPFGKDTSWGAPFANLKLGLQFIHYTTFNGGSSNYDGSGRSAADNDTLYAFAWFIF